MRRLIVALAVCLAPLTAYADPVVPAPALSMTERFAPYLDDYPMPPPRDLGGAPSGWGLHASLRGRSVDLASSDLGWGDDSLAGKGDMEAGYGWRGDDGSILFGYGQYDQGPRFDPGARLRPGQVRGDPGVLGLSLTLHDR